MRILQTLLVALFFLALSGPAQDLTIVHANVIDTATGSTQPNTTVVIRGNRILSVAPSSGAGARSRIVIDAKGAYLIPGLWDMHTHVYFDKTARDGTDLILPLLIVNGITGIRDMGSNLEPIFEASSPDEDKYLTGTKSPGMFLASWNAEREAKIIQLLAKNQVWQCPTLFWERGQWLVDAIDYTKDPDLAYAGHSWVARQWPALRKSILKSLDTDPLATRQKFVEHELGIVRRLHTAGVPFLAGTDTPAGVDVIPGISLHLELQRFVAAGFTPLQALQTATLDPARFYGKTEEFGTIQPGRIADLVMLSANPLENIANTRSITAVVADGRFFSSAELAALRTKLRSTAAGK